MNRFLFQGREYLPELRLYDFRNRLYQPELGRFLQPDPVGLQIEGAKPSEPAASFYEKGQAPKAFGSTELNLYRFCHNDPIDKSDPFGLEPIDVDPVLFELGVATARVMVYLQQNGGERGSKGRPIERRADIGRDKATGSFQTNESGYRA